MVLPISMEDDELFPHTKRIEIPEKSTRLPVDELRQMIDQLSRVWWSRLVISVRGYVANYIQHNDQALFLSDDAFIIIHQHLVESDAKTAERFLTDVDLIITTEDIPNILAQLDRGESIKNDPFTNDAFLVAFQRIFGEANSATFRVANYQKLAYLKFMNVLGILERRWISERKKRKSIRFKEDPEWQPDERVVLFQHFFEGNRTWVLTDFDRHILNVWRPNGSSVIFGDRFIKEKKQRGYNLCATCGMLEQCLHQFLTDKSDAFCSEKCHFEFEQRKTITQ
ncbi:hypothetical protein AB6A40_002826 [Gnathostoma spinigerum]|uniref:DUF8117 domain-containing protein n=1 Tax=Gnathostoma spinigerum TaxID=75299 RepID=A0ABD6EHS4_9BILA